MNSHRFTVVVLLSALCVGAQAQKWSATLTAANQVPPLTDPAVEGVEATFTMQATESGEIAWSLEVSGIQNLTMAHIHLGNDTTNGPPVVILVPVDGQAGADGSLPMLSSPVSGTFSVDMAMFGADNFTGPYEGATMEEFLQAADDMGLYVNLHTVEFPAGAVRGQVEPEVGAGWEAMLNAASQVPPLTEADVGGAMATFTLKQEGETYNYELTVDGVVNMTMAHIHMGNDTTNGAPVVILVPVGGAAGANNSLPVLDPPASGSDTYMGSFTADDLLGMPANEFQALLSDDPSASFYVNIHTTAFPAGAIRSQLYFAGTQEPATPPAASPEPAPMTPTPAPAPGPSSGAAAQAGGSLLLAALAVLAAAML